MEQNALCIRDSQHCIRLEELKKRERSASSLYCYATFTFSGIYATLREEKNVG